MRRFAKDVIRVVMLDADVLVQYGMRALLDQTPGIELVQQASTLADLQDGLACDVDVALLSLDTVLGHGDVLDDVIRYAALRTRVLVTSARIDAELIVRCLGAGATGFVWRGAEPHSIQGAVIAAVNGERPIIPPIAGDLLFHVLRSDSRSNPVSELTRREYEVLGFVADGLSNKEIATALDMSVRTVKAHVSQVLHKLGVEDRTQAAVLAIKEGMVGARTREARPRTSARSKEGVERPQ